MMHEKRDRKIDEGQRNGRNELPMLNEKVFHAANITKQQKKLKDIHNKKNRRHNNKKKEAKKKREPLTITSKKKKKRICGKIEHCNHKKKK